MTWTFQSYNSRNFSYLGQHMRFWYLSGIRLVILSIGDNSHEGDHGNNKEDPMRDTLCKNSLLMPMLTCPAWLAV